MGFRQGAYATVWEVKDRGNISSVRMSVSKKDKATGEYSNDFSGFCTFIGEAHKKASSLKTKDRIKILECDVSTPYDSGKQKYYTNFKVFDFENSSNLMATLQKPEPSSQTTETTEFAAIDEDDFPFA